MFCSNCGAKLENTAVFCGECGAKVEAMAASAVETAEETVKVTVAEAPVSEKKKGGKGGIVALIIILTLVLAGGGVAAWYFTSDGYNCKKYLKQAEAAFAEGELEDAKDYYETVLEYDETQKDIYVKLADIAIQDGKYESAIKTLQKGIKKTKEVEGAKEELTAKLEATYMAVIDAKSEENYIEALALADEAIAELNTTALTQKKTDIYMKQIDSLMSSSYYWDAIYMSGDAFTATKDKVFEEKKAEAYSKLAQQEISNGNFDYAWGLIEQGLYEVDSQVLKEDKVTLFKAWIDSYIADGDYSSAIRKAESAYDETKDDLFNDVIVGIYRTWADEYIEEGDYNSALGVLRDGVHTTGSTELSAKIDEINAAEVLTLKKVTDVQSGNFVVYLYNARGQETSIQYMDKYASMTEYRTYEYDEEGNVTAFRIFDGKGVLLSGVDYTWEEAEGEKLCLIAVIDGESRVLTQEVLNEDYKTISSTEYDAEDGSVRVLKQYEYDEAGNQLTETIVTDEETIINKNEYIYDDAGNMLESISLDAEGNPIIRNSHDEDGNIIESIEYDEDGEVVCTEESTYDSMGNMLTYKIVSEEYNYHTMYTYDENGELLQYTYVDDVTGDEQATVYNTVKEDNVVTIETIDYYNGEEISYRKKVSEYNEDGKLLNLELTDRDGMVLGAETIKYDEKGNETYTYSEYDDECQEYSIIYQYGFPER